MDIFNEVGGVVHHLKVQTLAGKDVTYDMSLPIFR